MTDPILKNRTSIALAVSFLLGSVGLLTGCQNEKDDGNPVILEDIPAVITPQGETTVSYPTLISVIPATDAENVELDASLTLIFSEDLLATTVNATSLSLTDGAGEVLDVEIAFDGAKTVTLTPASPLKALTDYVLKVTPGLTDQEGVGLESELELSFSTRDGAWLNAELIEFDNQGDAGQPEVAFDGDGNAIAVWQQLDALGHSSIWTNRYVIGEGWQVPADIDGTLSNSVDAVIAAEASGDATAVWLREEADGSHSVVAKQYTADQGWGAVIELDALTGDAQAPAVASNASGQSMVVWTQEDTDGQVNVYASELDSEGNATAPMMLDSVAGSASNPQVAVNASGRAVAVWSQQEDAGSEGIWASHYDAATQSWSDAELIESRVPDGSEPQIAIDSTGNALSVWLQDDGDGNNSVWGSYFSDGEWLAPLLIEFASGHAASPAVASEPSGTFRAVWTQQDASAVAHVWSNVYEPATQWMSPVVLESNEGAADSPNISLDANGHGIAIWQQQGATGNSSIWVNRLHGSDGWSDAATIENESGDAQAPFIALDDQGNALAVWQQTDSDGTQIVANRFTMTPSDAADSIAPTVVSTLPVSGAASVATTATAEVVFSESVQPGALPSSVILLKNDVVVPASVSFDGDRTVLLTPSGSLDAGTRYTLEVGTDVRDLAGNPMTADYRGTFTTTEALWRGESAIDAASGPAYFSDVAVTEEGDAVAVWNQLSESGVTQIWSNRYTQQAGWGVPERLDSDDNYALAPTIEFDQEGNAVAVWLQDNGAFANKLWANTLKNGVWATAEEIGAGIGAAGKPHLLVAANGTAYVTWSESIDENSTGVFVNTLSSGSSWGGAEQVGASQAFANDPRIASDANGGLTVAWSQVVGTGDFQIWANRFAAGGDWGNPRQINSGSGDALEVQIASDAKGNAVAVWRQNDGNGLFSVLSNRFSVGTGWGVAEFREQAAGDADDIRVVSDSAGKTVALWTQRNLEGKYDIWLSTYESEAGWDVPALIETREGIAYAIDVSLSEDGRMAVVWHQDDGDGTYSIWASRYSDAFGWVEPVEIEAGSGNAINPSVGINSHGQAMAVWIQQSNGAGDVQANAFK